MSFASPGGSQSQPQSPRPLLSIGQWSLDEPTTPFRSKSVYCSPLRKSLGATASLRINGSEPIRCEKASHFLEAARSTANFLEKSSILNDLSALDIADDVEGLDEEKWNLQVVQKRLQVREAFIVESFATRRLKECLQQPTDDERRWPIIEDAVEAGEIALPKLKEAQLSQSKKLAGRLKMTLNQWQLGVMNRLDEVVEAQDLELLEDLHPWIERSRLDQRPDAASLLQEIDRLLNAFDALKTALEVGTGPAFRAALWASEEAGLRADRCEMLQRVDLGYGPIRSRNTARWAMLGACAAGSKVLLEGALPACEEAGLNVEPIQNALDKFDSRFFERLSQLAQLTRAARTEDVKQLEAALSKCKLDESKLGKKTDLEKLVAEVRSGALQTLFDAKQKAKVHEEIKVSLTKSSTQVLKDLPTKMKEAAKLRMSQDLRQASSTYRRALLENQIKSAISLSDSHALRSVLAKAEHSDLEGMEEILTSGRAALHEMSHLEAARAIVSGAMSVKDLETDFDKLIKDNFPDGLKPQSSLRRVQAEFGSMKAKLEELQTLLETPLAFENNNTLLQETGMRQMRLVLDILRVHPYFAISIEYGQAHLAGERAKAVLELFKKGCRNPLSKKQLKEKSKVVRMSCQMDKCTPELKSTLGKMLIKCAI